MMKNAKLFLSVTALFFSLSLISCSKESFDQFAASKEIITQGKWSIDYYFEGQDQTARFQGYEFDFNGDGSLVVTNGTETFNGTWTSYRNTGYQEVLNISFETMNTDLSSLDTDWNVGALSPSSVAMKDAANTQLRFHKL